MQHRRNNWGVWFSSHKSKLYKTKYNKGNQIGLTLSLSLLLLLSKVWNDNCFHLSWICVFLHLIFLPIRYFWKKDAFWNQGRGETRTQAGSNNWITAATRLSFMTHQAEQIIKTGRGCGKTYSALLSGQRKSTRGQSEERWRYHSTSRNVGLKMWHLIHWTFSEELVFCSPACLSLNWITCLVQELQVRRGQTVVSQ